MKNNEILNKIKNAVEENENNCESIMMRAFQDFVKKKVAVSENDKKDDNVKRTYEESIQDKFEEMKKSNEPIFCISPTVFWSIQNEDSTMKDTLSEKKVDYKWVGKAGILITKSNFLKMMQVIFRRLTGMSLTFDKSKKSIFWTKVYSLRRVDWGSIEGGCYKLIKDYTNEKSPEYILNLTDNSRVYVIDSGYAGYSKFINDHDPIYDPSYIEKCIKIYKIKESYRRSKVKWISRKELERVAGWLNENEPDEFDYDWYVKQIYRLGLVEDLDWNDIGTTHPDFEFTVKAAQELLNADPIAKNIDLSKIKFEEEI